MRMTRKTSLGFGRKTDLDYGKHRHNVTPSPDNYKIDSFVDLNAAHHRGMSAHIGREVPFPSSSSPLPAATSSSTASSSQDQAATRSSASMRLPSGRCAPSPTPNVGLSPRSLRENHAGHRSRAWHSRIQSGDPPQGTLFRLQIPQLRVKGLESTVLTALPQVHH